MSLDWIVNAKDWIFSGAGTVLVVSASSYIWKLFRKRSIKFANKNNEKVMSKPTNLGEIFFKYSLVAKKAIQIHNVTRDHIDDLILSQYNAHPLLKSLNYQSLPIPLSAEFHAIISKQALNCTIEDIRTTITEESLLTAWTELRNAYFKAYNLKFRHDHTILMKRSELEHTRKTIEKLFVAAQEYYAVRSATLKMDERGNLHSLKNRSATALLHLEYLLHSDDSHDDAGNGAVQVEMAISAIHKILLDQNLSGDNRAN